MNTEFVDVVGMATKIINRHSKAEKISKLTVLLELLQNYISFAKFQFLNDGVRAGCPKLGHTTQLKKLLNVDTGLLKDTALQCRDTIKPYVLVLNSKRCSF